MPRLFGELRLNSRDYLGRGGPHRRAEAGDDGAVAGDQKLFVTVHGPEGSSEGVGLPAK